MSPPAFRLTGRSVRPLLAGGLLLLAALAGCVTAPQTPPPAATAGSVAWVGTWATSPLVENKDDGKKRLFPWTATAC